jgi:hypothetical protein
MEVIMGRKCFLLLIIAWFLLVGCATQQLRKEATLDNLGTFKFNERKHIYETFDELANRLRASRYYVVLKKKEIKIDDDVMILELADRDGDGKADSFACTPKKGGDTQDFGFIFDLNKDGKIDYIVFNQGIAMTKDMKVYWSKYHWIDSNYDGKIDIHVLPTIDLDGDKFPDKGVTGWIYDTDFDGDVDKVEYLGEDFQKPVEKTEGDFIIKAWTGEDKVGKDYFVGMSKILSAINSLYP